MRIFTSFFCVLLLVGGVSGVEKKIVTFSVMKGDSVTLNPDDAEIKTGDQILWKFEGSIIGTRKTDGSISTYDGPGGISKEKLLLDKQTGSLTITDLTTDHTGLYQLEIRSTTETWKKYNVTVSDVVESLSVMEGDSVTLHTGVKLHGSDQIVWKFGDQVIPITNLNSATDGKWSNSHLNNQTGELTIKNIQINQIGVYKMETNTRSMILYRKFPIVSGVTGGVKTVSVKEGEIIILHTGVIDIDSEGYNLILWKTGDVILGEINKKTKRYYRNEEIYKGRLQLHPNDGFLIISDSKTTDSGVYHLNMSSSSHTLQRTITVTVSALSGAPSGICGAGVGLVVWALTVFLLQEV